MIVRAGSAAQLAWQEHFTAVIANIHTRMAYSRAVRQFLDCRGLQTCSLDTITPSLVEEYFKEHRGNPATRRVHRAAIRGLFDTLIAYRVMTTNPALFVPGQWYPDIEHKTPEITVDQARQLIGSLNVTTTVGLRDRAIIGVLIYTAARSGSIAQLRLRHYAHDGNGWTLFFEEKRATSRIIAVRHELASYIYEYMESAGLICATADTPLFRTAIGTTDRLTVAPMNGCDLWRMVRRRLREAGLPTHLSPHSFRVNTITALLSQGIPVEAVQFLAGHSDPRTTSKYDRRRRRETRDIVARITV